MNGIRIHDLNRTTGPRHRDRHLETRAGATQGKGRATQAGTVGKLHHRVVSRNSRCKTRRNLSRCRISRPTGIIRGKRSFIVVHVSDRHRPARRVRRISCIDRDLTLINNGLLIPALQYYRNPQVKYLGTTQHGEASR